MSEQSTGVEIWANVAESTRPNKGSIYPDQLKHDWWKSEIVNIHLFLKQSFISVSIFSVNNILVALEYSYHKEIN